MHTHKYRVSSLPYKHTHTLVETKLMGVCDRIRIWPEKPDNRET